METRKVRTKVVVSVLVLTGLVVFVLSAVGGNLEPGAPPGKTMRTLDEIYNLSSSLCQPNVYVPKVDKGPTDMFLQGVGIPGEITEAGHEGWIEVVSYSHGISRPTGGVMQPSEHDDFKIVKVLERSSPLLSLACCQGNVIPNVKMELCRATGGKHKYMEYNMIDVVVKSVRPGGSAQGGESIPLEEVTFYYGKIDWEYVESDYNGNPTGGKVQAGCDVVSNQPR